MVSPPYQAYSQVVLLSDLEASYIMNTSFCSPIPVCSCMCLLCAHVLHFQLRVLESLLDPSVQGVDASLNVRLVYPGQ